MAGRSRAAGVRHRTAAELEGDDPVLVLVLDGGTARRHCPDAYGRAAIADLDGDILLAVDRIGYRRGHDVAAGLDLRQHLSSVGGVDPELAAAAALEHQIASGAHYAAVIAADAGRRFMFPNRFLRHGIPGPQQLAHQLALAGGLQRLLRPEAARNLP